MTTHDQHDAHLAAVYVSINGKVGNDVYLKTSGSELICRSPSTILLVVAHCDFHLKQVSDSSERRDSLEVVCPMCFALYHVSLDRAPRLRSSQHLSSHLPPPREYESKLCLCSDMLPSLKCTPQRFALGAMAL